MVNTFYKLAVFSYSSMLCIFEAANCIVLFIEITFRIFIAPENDVILLVTYTKRNALTFLIKHGEEFPNDLSN